MDQIAVATFGLGVLASTLSWRLIECGCSPVSPRSGGARAYA
jgi:hypothetical protein